MNLHAAKAGKRLPDRFGPGQVLACGYGIERCDLFSSEAHSDHLHRLGASSRATASPPLQLVDVVTRLGFVSPPLDLLISHHEQIV